MTERASAANTQIAKPFSPGSTPPTTAFSAATAVAKDETEEPYTIKCICQYPEDDGNTIYCEACDTWQHIECFYPGRVDDASKEEFDHSCADCNPRPLDRKHAAEYQRLQRLRRASTEGGDKKTKRPPSKSHKKKTKPSDLLVNGYLHDHDSHKHGSPQDHHSHSHAKKPRGHRSSQSISSQIKRSPPSQPFNPRLQNHAHPPSPAHTPPDLPNNFQVHSYSDNFLSLYNDENSTSLSQTNSFASLNVTNSMSLWLHNSEKLLEDAGISDKADIFQDLIVPIESLKWFELQVEQKAVTVNDVVLRWKYLTTPTHLPPAGRIGELNGLVGFQKDYCDDAENRWLELAHPRPFVFFHPRLPLFIDTRREGSKCRYVRRSCRANTSLETFIANKSEYHFWLISERPVPANEQITLPWDFRFPTQYRARFLHLLNLGDEDGVPFDGGEITDAEYDQLAGVIHLVLSDYGGCACDLGSDCAFARFHRNYYHGKAQIQSNIEKAKKGRRPKQQHVSPTSTGHATNSRAESEGQYDDDDSRSTSGSTRSKPRSRDLTPHGEMDINGGQLEMSDREKRKIAMVEASFKKIEQEQPARKKKRVSDGSNMASSTTPQPAAKSRQRSVAPRPSISQMSSTNGNGSRPRQYVDASTSRQPSGSPFSALSPTAALPSPDKPASRAVSHKSRSRQPSITPKVNYVDASMQTDPVEDEWYSPNPRPKKPIISLAKRLCKNRLKIKQQRERQQAQRMEQAAVVAVGGERQSVRASPNDLMDLDEPTIEEQDQWESPTDEKHRNDSISSSTLSVDAASTSVDVAMTDLHAVTIGNSVKPPLPAWPSTQNPTVTLDSAPVSKPSGLQVQLPPAPNISVPTLPGAPSGSVTPSSATATTAQSPFSSIPPSIALPSPTINGICQHSSPVKTTKKLTLSDYIGARRQRTDSAGPAKAASGSSPTVAPAVLKTSLSTVESASSPVILEGSAIVDTPAEEKATDPLRSAEPLPPSLPSEKTNGSL